MKVIDHFHELDDCTLPIVTSGTFDGVHSGHFKILRGLVRQARDRGGESVVITYWPHPRFVLGMGSSSLKLLTTFDEKVKLLGDIGIDYLLKVRFSKEFSELSPENFVQKILIKGIKAKKFIIGYDHRFGKNQVGDIDFLKKNKKRFGLEIEEISRLDIDQVGISSTNIREALAAGDVDTAQGYLGRYYSISGIVIRGDQIGRKIGYPTANLFIPENYKLIPSDGVYAIFVYLGFERFHGMLNIGWRPTIKGKKKTIEAHFFDFNKDIYGRHLRVELVAIIRKEIEFNHLDDLKAQLDKDSRATKKLLSKINYSI